jgi:outer membrane protein TolC
MYGKLLLFLLLPAVSWGQLDSTILTEDQLIWFVKNYHPVAVQGELVVESGESAVRASRGGFDPVLEGDIDQKYFDDKSYYSLINGGLKIPTWFGVEVKTGYDDNSGEFLNPENNVPNDGLWYAGISIPIGQGLFIDQRRASLRQAEIYAESTLVEQRRMLNDLFLDAISDYWNWVEKYNEYLVYQDYVALAQERLDGIKKSFEFGDIPAIDTLEAHIQRQNRELNMEVAKLNFQKSTLQLSNYLWFEGNIPLEISDDLRPPKLSEIGPIADVPSLSESTVLLTQNHPELMSIDFELSLLEIDRRLKAESLKPKLDLNYNALAENTSPNFVDSYRIEDYKWGLEFSFPLFLRKQRGELQLANIKIRDTGLKQSQKLLSLENKLKSAYFELLNLNDQVALVSDIVVNYNRLLDGEKQKFDAGESSLFLINSRETSLIDSQLKQNQLTVKQRIARLNIFWASGDLMNQFID